MAWTEPLDILENGDPVYPVPPTAPQPLDLDTALLLAHLLMHLQRVVTDPGSGHRKFLQGIRGKAPDLLTTAQRAHVMRLAWRYRSQLPNLLRPGCDPDKKPNEGQP